jgi:hypothetical protein
MSAQVCADCTAAYSIGAPACPQCGANNPRADGDTASSLTVTVRCPGQECPAYGTHRVVSLRLAAPGVVERPPLHCTECGRALETVHDEEQEKEQDMPKTTVHNGPSVADVPETEVVMANGDLAVTGEAVDETPEEESSPTPDADGGTSSTSSETEPTSPEQSESGPAKPARTTGSRSSKGRTGSSTARGTDGAPTDGTSATASDNTKDED